MIATELRYDWRSLGEALGVFTMIMLYIWWVRLYQPWTVLALMGLVVGTHFIHGEGARWLGFGWKSFREAFPAVVPWVSVVALVLFGAGLLLGTVRDVTLVQATFSTIAYVAWGLVQQYLLNGYFTNRLMEFRARRSRHFVPLLAAGLFSLAHLPNWFLMPVTFIGGYVCVRVYLRYRSLYVLALAHGIVGFVLFLIVPDSVSAHFLIGPRYLLLMYESYPELLL